MEFIRSSQKKQQKPDLVIYLKIRIYEELMLRICESGKSINYWGAGMDIGLSDDLYESFVKYQTLILNEFDQMTDEFIFKIVEASCWPKSVNSVLKNEIEKLL